MLLWLLLLQRQLQIKKFKQLIEENFKKFEIVATREGRNINISDEEFLVWDKYKVGMGMVIPADDIVINFSNLKIDEAWQLKII